jgi:hypothetical protein
MGFIGTSDILAKRFAGFGASSGVVVLTLLA